MKILVEILERDSTSKPYRVIQSKTVIISSIKNNTTIKLAKEKLAQLKLTLKTNQKIRVLEYHNDDKDDKNRKPCIILYD